MSNSRSKKQAQGIQLPISNFEIKNFKREPNNLKVYTNKGTISMSMDTQPYCECDRASLIGYGANSGYVNNAKFYTTKGEDGGGSITLRLYNKQGGKTTMKAISDHNGFYSKGFKLGFNF